MFFTGSENKNDLQSYLKKNGFLILKNIFEDNEVELIKNLFGDTFELQKLTLHSATHLPGPSHLINDFGKIITSKKLVNTLKKICDNDLAYTSHSDLQNGVAGDWHKDDGKGKYFGHLTDYFSNDEVMVYKVGVYLRDCTSFGGLTVKRGSHLIKNKQDGEEVYLPSTCYDAIIFDVRITHRGWLPIEPPLIEFFKKILKKLRIIHSNPKVPFERKSLFFTYGANNEYTEIFAKTNMERQISQLKKDISIMPEELRKKLISENIKFYF